VVEGRTAAARPSEIRDDYTTSSDNDDNKEVEEEEEEDEEEDKDEDNDGEEEWDMSEEEEMEHTLKDDNDTKYQQLAYITHDFQHAAEVYSCTPLALFLILIPFVKLT
jgi:hypothetical protein